MNTELLDPDDRTKQWRRLTVSACLAAGVVFVYPLVLPTPLLDPSEGFHAAVAQEMLEKGDWVAPSFLGEPFLDKSVFYTWLQALSLWCFGLNEPAVRLPGLLFGLLAAASTYLAASRMFGRITGVLSGMLYTTTILPAALTQAAPCDVVLVPLVTLAMWLLWEWDRALPRWAAACCCLTCGVLLGLSILTKGLTALVTVAVGYVAHLLWTRRLAWRHCLKGAAVLAVASAVCLPWYLAIEHRFPGYLDYFFVHRHLLGYVTKTQPHGAQPWWFYLPVLVGGGFPWLVYLPTVVQESRARQRSFARALGTPVARPSDGSLSLLWCWLIAGTVFFSAAHSKLVTYIWPLFPPLAILAAISWAWRLEGTLTASARKMHTRAVRHSCLVAPLCLPTAMWLVQRFFGTAFPTTIWAAALLAAAAGLAPLFFLQSRDPLQTLRVGVLCLLAHFLVIISLVAPFFAPVLSARDLSAHFSRLGSLPSYLWIADERVGSVVFYLDTKLRAALKPEQIRGVPLERWGKAEPGTIVALAERNVERAGRFLKLRDVPFQRAGHYRLYRHEQLLPLRPLLRLGRGVRAY